MADDRICEAAGLVGELLLLLTLHLVLTGLPGVAAVLAGARGGLSSVPLLLALGLAASGATAMLVFWAYYADPVAGESAAFLLLFGSVGLTGWALYGKRVDPALLRALATPLALWALGSAFVLFLGFVHGGIDTPLDVSRIRFSHELPGDNYIPQYFADWFYVHGHQGTPPLFPGEWLSSDRPPLQVGYVLAQRPLKWDGNGLHYQVLGVVLQQLWIVGLWALLLAARSSRMTRALAMLAVLLSPIAILNGFFVWPKLLPAAMLLAAAALVATPLWSQVRRSVWGAALVATLLGLALLGHGASVFGVVPLAAVTLYRGLPGWRWLGVGLAVGLALVGPWSAYQRYGDPPGDRLTKWFAAGVIEIDDRGVGEAVVDSYGEAGVGGAIENKAENFDAMVGGTAMWGDVENVVDAIGGADPEGFVRSLRTIFFFYLLPSLGLLLIAPVAIALGWRRRRGDPADWTLALACLAIFGLGCLGWGLLMFGGETAQTVVHQGTYLLPVIGLCGAVAGLRAVYPRFAPWFVAVAALLSLAIYAPALDPPPGSAYSASAILLSLGSLAGFAVVALRGAEGSAEPHRLAR